MSRLYALSSEIKLMSTPADRMCGVALTVKVCPGDNLMLHQALNLAQEGDIIVVANEGDRTHSIMGEIMYKYLADFKKVAGIVIDGPIRDIDILSKSSCPIYATGTTPGGPYKEGPGDIILGDADGVIVIPKSDAAALISKAEENAQADHAKVLKFSNGTVNRQWVNEALEKTKVEIINDTYPF